MKLTRRQSLMSLVTTALWQWLPRSAHAADRNYAGFNAAFATQIAIPSLTVFENAAGALVKATEVFQQKPDQAGFESVRSAFGNLSDAWMAVQLLRFGPLSQSQRLDRISYWPERRSIIDKQLAAFVSAGDKSKLEAASFSNASVAVQGLAAMERLLYDGEDPLHRYTDGSPTAAYRAALILAIARNLEQIAKEARISWQDLAPKLAKGDQGGFGATPEEATGQIYAGLLTNMQIVGDQKIGLALGKGADLAKPKQAEQWRAGRSLHNIALNLKAVRQAIIGGTPGSFDAFLTAPTDTD
ncbi:MAG: imelysin family protein, partial [Dongiaceae bacterium]